MGRRGALCACVGATLLLWAARLLNLAAWGSFLFLAGARIYPAWLFVLAVMTALFQCVAYQVRVAALQQCYNHKRAEEIFK